MMQNLPTSFFDLSVVPNTYIDAKYATCDNFTTKKLPGYHTTKNLWLHNCAKKTLIHLTEVLETQGLGLWIWDAYRPKRATDAMVEWAKRTKQYHLVTEGYIAIRSRHNGGGAIDCSLYDLQTKKILNMGTEWDTFDSESHIQNATGQAMENRRLLHSYMNEFGWVSYEKEWWHFEMPDAKNLDILDVPYFE
jgi:zinc D-Ala-D-Ala dipeptidase